MKDFVLKTQKKPPFIPMELQGGFTTASLSPSLDLSFHSPRELGIVGADAFHF